MLLSRPDSGGAPTHVIAYRGLRGGAPVVTLGGAEAGERQLEGAGRLGGEQEPVTLEVVSADDETLRLTIDTRLEISYDADAGALGPGVAESLLAEDEGAELVAWLLREGSGRPALAAEHFGWPLDEARARLDRLVEDGRAERTGPGTYSARLGSRRASARWETRSGAGSRTTVATLPRPASSANVAHGSRCSPRRSPGRSSPRLRPRRSPWSPPS